MQGEYNKIIQSSNNTERTEIKIFKGVKASVMSKLTTSDFRECRYKKIQVGTMYLFKSKLHQIYTPEYKRITLSHLDDKLYVKENNVDTLAWGHKDIA